ncbi:hypothetical protein ScPMuIL_013044 [Solemya velum]
MITIMYILIGVTLRNSEVLIDQKGDYNHTAATTKARKAVLKMLVAVVVAFFACWAPFHSQRLMTIYIKDWTEELLKIQTYLFYISGTLYFVSSTVNPILYNVMSRKYRRAFKRTLCCCLLSEDFSLDVSVFGSTNPPDATKKQNSLPYSYSRLLTNKGRTVREALTVNTSV